jgi:hypothetical protein
MVCVLFAVFFLRCLPVVASNQLVAYDAQAHVNSSRGPAKVGNEPFMIVSGITAPMEMCLAVTDVKTIGANNAIDLVPCAAAIAAGDGREIFSMQSNGQLLSVFGNECVGLLDNNAVSGGRLVLMGCDAALGAGDGRSNFDFQGNGQVAIGLERGYCVSSSGDAVGNVNVASHAAVSATSTANAPTHGAPMAVDGNEFTFWASSLIAAREPVEFIVDWGSDETLHSMQIFWEFRPKSFAISLASSNSPWEHMFATDVNVVWVTQIQLNTLASKAKVRMVEVQPLDGEMYGIKTISLFARRLRTIVAGCAEAGRSKDARDKLFLSQVKTFQPEASKPYLNIVSQMEAAMASLSTAASELLVRLSKLGACSGVQQLALGNKLSVPFAAGKADMALLQQHMRNQMDAGAATGVQGNGSDLDSAKQMLAVARAAIMDIKRVLNQAA